MGFTLPPLVGMGLVEKYLLDPVGDPPVVAMDASKLPALAGPTLVVRDPYARPNPTGERVRKIPTCARKTPGGREREGYPWSRAARKRRLVIVSSSGGIDSTALLIATRRKYPRAMLLIERADTGSEPPDTMETLRLVSELVKAPVINLQPPRFLNDHILDRGEIPNMAGSFKSCSSVLKGDQLDRLNCWLTREREDRTTAHLSGLLYEEPKRVYTHLLSQRARFGPMMAEEALLYNEGISKAKAMRILEQAGIPLSSTYLDRARHGCIPCKYWGELEWQRYAQVDPAGFTVASDLEQYIARHGRRRASTSFPVGHKFKKIRRIWLTGRADAYPAGLFLTEWLRLWDQEDPGWRTHPVPTGIVRAEDLVCPSPQVRVGAALLPVMGERPVEVRGSSASSREAALEKRGVEKWHQRVRAFESRWAADPISWHERGTGRLNITIEPYRPPRPRRMSRSPRRLARRGRAAMKTPVDLIGFVEARVFNTGGGLLRVRSPFPFGPAPYPGQPPGEPDRPALGYIMVGPAKGEHAKGIWEVAGVQAEPGWGPFLYDLALELVNVEGARGLAPDRTSVSNDALKVWDHYLAHRRDVTSRPLPRGYIDRDKYRLGGAAPQLDRVFRKKGTPFLDALGRAGKVEWRRHPDGPTRHRGGQRYYYSYALWADEAPLGPAGDTPKEGAAYDEGAGAASRASRRARAARAQRRAVRESARAKRPIVGGTVVEKIPYKVAAALAERFPQSFLGEAHGALTNMGGGVNWLRSWSRRPAGKAELFLAGSLRRQFPSTIRLASSLSATVTTPGAGGPVGDLDFVLVAPSFPEWPKESPPRDLVQVSGGDRMRTYRFRAREQGKNWDVQVNVMRADPKELGATLMYATGPGGWNAMMRLEAMRVGLKLNRYGLFEAGGKRVAGETELSIFEALAQEYKLPHERGDEKSPWPRRPIHLGELAEARVRRPSRPRDRGRPVKADKASKPPSARVVRTQAGRARQRFESAESQGLNPYQATMGRIRAMKRPEKMLGTSAFLQALREERPGSRGEIDQLIAAIDSHLAEVDLAPPPAAAGAAQGYFAPTPGEGPGALVADLPGVLLAKKWTGKEDVTCYWLSEKLDGVRAIWDGERFWSRSWNPFNAPDWFRKLMPAGVVLDGELWAGRGQFRDTISAVRRKVPNDPQWRKIQYLAFDLPMLQAPFEARMKKLAQVTRKGGRHLQMVAQRLCVDNRQLAAFHRDVVKKGGEGVMLRRVGSVYEPKRSSTLLKLKEFHDQEARVVGHERGLGKHLGRLGAYRAELLSTGARFKVGTGLTDLMRENPLPIGSVITVRYQELTPAGIPRFPSFVSARDYE